jgi:hypothetical protein
VHSALVRATRRAVLTTVLIGGLTGCSVWDAGDRGTAYTISNHCNEDLMIAPVDGGNAIALPARTKRVVRTFDQEPDQPLVVSRPDGTDAVRFVPGMSVIAIEDDVCPSDH